MPPAAFSEMSQSRIVSTSQRLEFGWWTCSIHRRLSPRRLRVGLPVHSLAVFADRWPAHQRGCKGEVRPEYASSSIVVFAFARMKKTARKLIDKIEINCNCYLT